MLNRLCVLSPATNAVKRILAMYTVFALFEAVVTSDYEPANIGPMMKGLMQRSNITTGGALAILAYYTQASTPNQTHIACNSFVALLVLCLCLLNKAYFEGSPVENFKKRVRALTAVGAAILVTVPEMYLLLFIIVEGHNLIGLAAVFTALGMVVLHVLMTSLLNGME